MENILEVTDLTVKIEDRTLISNVSFVIPKGFLICVSGENGVGKSTLVKTLLKRRFHSDQHVKFMTDPNDVQTVPQFRNVDDEYPLSIRDFVTLGRPHSLLPWLSSSEKHWRHEVLSATNLTKIAKEPLGRASGGEKQRAYLAQTLMSNPRLLILDETTASLDKDAKITLLKLVSAEIKRKLLTVVFITHDPGLIQKFGNYELNISNQKAVMRKIGDEQHA